MSDLDQNIEEMCADNLSDLSVSDIESDSSEFCDSDYSNESESDDDTDVQPWSSTDAVPEIEPFIGYSGVRVMPNSPDNISDIVNLFIGDDLFTFMVEESNRYYEQNREKYKTGKKTLKWKSITLSEMKKFCGLIILMGQVRKDVIYDYWSTEPSIETPFFSKVMSRERFRVIWQSWHFNNNENLSDNSDRLQKVQTILSYFQKKFNNVYAPEKELSLDEAIIPWRGKLIFRTYNPAKITKYGILVRVVCEARSGYICNFKVYCGSGQKLEETILSVLEPYNNLWHHVYLDNYYNSVHTATTLLNLNFRICGTIRKNRGVPNSLKNIKLAIGETSFLRKNDILLQVWRPKKTSVFMISTIHSADMKDSNRLNRKTGNFFQKPECILEYNKYMKGVDRADQYLSYYKIFRKTKKWTKRVVMFFLNCALFNSFKVYIKLNGQKMSYKQFLHSVAMKWIHNDVVENDPAEDIQPGPSNITTPRTPKYDPPGRLSGDLKKHKIIKIVTGGKKKCPQRQCRVCAVSKKKSLTSFICKFCGIPLHKGSCFERYHSLQKY